MGNLFLKVKYMSCKNNVFGLGEILWDMFPHGRSLGGAPLNFAYHCNQLGFSSCPVSCLGRDELGAEARVRLVEMGLSLDYVAEDRQYPTGHVNVEVDQRGVPVYTIREQVAWDVIPSSPEFIQAAKTAEAVCFGSLAQRCPVSADTIHLFLSSMPSDSLKFFDVNLRQSFYSKTCIEQSLKLANVLKLSDEELPVLASMFDLSGPVTEQLTVLRERFNLRLVAYTRGGGGSLLMTDTDMHDHSGHPSEVVDTVGAGDSFTATLCVDLLHDVPLPELNDHANQVAAFVCSQKGATPPLPNHLKGVNYAAQ